MFLSLFQIRRQHIFDPFHECSDSARQIAPMCYDEGHGERPATKIRYDLHKRSALQVSANPQEWRRGLSDLLAGRVPDRPQGFRLQPRVVGAARLRHLDLRRGGGDRDRRRAPGPAAGACGRLFARRDLRCDRGTASSGAGERLHVARAAGGGGVDGAGGEDGRRRGRRGRFKQPERFERNKKTSPL